MDLQPVLEKDIYVNIYITNIWNVRIVRKHFTKTAIEELV